MYKKNIIIFLLMHYSSLYTTITINQAPFPFTIRAMAYDRAHALLFIGSNQVITNEKDKERAISMVIADKVEAKGITPKAITLNQKAGQPNPLYGSKINFMALSHSSPFIVAAHLDHRVHFLKDPTSSHPVLFQTDPLTEGAGLETSGVVGLAALPGITVKTTKTEADGTKTEIEHKRYDNFFAAVRPNNGLFGEANSGIVLGSLHAEEKEFIKSGVKQTVVSYSLRQDNFFSLDRTNPALKIGSDLVAIDPTAVTMVASNFPNLIYAVYTGLLVTGGPNITDGARSIVRNTIQGISMMAPNAALEADSIIGGLGPNIQVSAHFLDTLYTSSHLDYLVVVGGVGDPAATKKTVYALPLTRSGLLAKKTAIPETHYITSPSSTSYFAGRFFPDSQAAAVVGDLYSPASPDIYQARVGGGASLPGAITALFAEKDTVFVAVGSSSAGELGGLFYSQALLDAEGRIMGWTNWKRATNIVTPIFGMAFDANMSLSWFLPGNDINELTLLKKTEWYRGGLSAFDKKIQESFESDIGSQGLFDFHRQNLAFNQEDGSRFSMMVATGNQKVLLLESGGDDVTGLFTPTETISNTFTATDGSLTGFSSAAQAITMTGGALHEIGPIIAAEIVSDTISSWLLVGGSHGLAVLANIDGSGWPVGSLTKGFSGLPATVAWKLLSPFAQVRKIIADGSTVYVLTTNSLVRFQASATSFSSGSSIDVTTLATAEGLIGKQGTFSDFIVSGGLGLLATSEGLLRSGNGDDIATDDHVSWKLVNLPESPGPVTRIFVISPTEKIIDFATTERGGNIYVLSAAVRPQQARIYRLSIQGLPLSEGKVTNGTVTSFQDQFIEGRISTYLNIGDYRNYIATDGASLFMSRSAYYPTKKSSYVHIAAQELRSGMLGGITVGLSRGGFVIFSPNLEEKADKSVVFQPSRIGPFVQRSATGSWMLAGSTILVQT